MNDKLTKNAASNSERDIMPWAARRIIHLGQIQNGWIPWYWVLGVVACVALTPKDLSAANYTSTQTSSLGLGDTVETTGAGTSGYGLWSKAGTLLNAPGSNTIRTQGDSAHGLMADSLSAPQSNINAVGTNITVEGSTAYAAYAKNGSSLTLGDVKATANGANGKALYVDYSSTATVSGNSEFVSERGTAIETAGSNATVVIDGAVITSKGDNAYGLRIFSGSSATVTGATKITTTGANSTAVWSSSNGLQSGGGAIPEIGDGAFILTTGGGSYGVIGTGTAGRGVKLNAATVSTQGDGAGGIRAQFDGLVQLNGTSVSTSGKNSPGLIVGSTTANDNSGSVVSTGASISTTGDGSAAVVIYGTQSHKLTLDSNSQITTTGAASHGISLQGGAVKTFSSANPSSDVIPAGMVISGADSAGLHSTGTGSELKLSINLPTMALGSQSWSALAEEGGTIVFSGSADASSGKFWANGSGSAQEGKLVFEQDSKATGATLRLDGSGLVDISGNNDHTLFSIGALEGSGGAVKLGSSAATSVSLTVDGAATTTYAGDISGFGDLVRKGSGQLTLTGAQAFGFSGNVEIGAGTLAVGGLAVSAQDKDFNFTGGGGGILDISQSTNGFTVGTLQSAAVGNGTILLGTQSLTVSGAGDSDFSGSIQGSGGLTKQGAGNLQMSGPGAFGYAGTTSIQGGKITALGSATSSGKAIEIGSPGILDLSGASSFAAGTVNGSGTIQLGANNLTVDGTGASLFDGAITGTGGLIKRNTGVLKLSGATAFGFGGDATIQGGVLAIRGNVDPATFSKRFLLDGGWLDLSESNVPANEGSATNWPHLVIDTTGSTAGGVIGANDNVRYEVAAGQTELVPYHLGDASTPGGQGIFVVKSGAGTLELTNQNDYVGNTRVDGGVLRVRADSNIGSLAASREVVLNGGDLEVAGSFVSSRNVELRQNGTVIVGAGVDTSWRSVLGAGMVLTKSGDGSMAFRDGGTLGGVTVGGGKLALQGASIGAAGIPTPVQMHAGSLTLSGGSVTGGGDAILVDGDSVVTLSNVAINVPNAAYRVVNNAQASLNLIGQELKGLVAADGAGTVLQVNMDQASQYTGVPQASGGAKVGLSLNDANSTWTVPANAKLTSLVNRGNIQFTAPVEGRYKALEVAGDYVGGGKVSTNTVLNAGGALAAQYTDRLLIHGDVTGQTILMTTQFTGEGANTNVAGNHAYMPAEGISLVQVGGKAQADAFKLPNDYFSFKDGVQYRLFAYGTGTLPAPDQKTQSLLGATPLSVDFRLQAAYVDKNDNIVPGVPDDNGNGNGNPRPALVPQGSSYLSAGMAMQNYSSFVTDNLRRRLGDLRQSDAAGENAAVIESYARVIGARDKYRSNRGFQEYGYDFDQNSQAMQFGANWLALNDLRQRVRIGGAVTLGSSKVNTRASSAEQSKFSMDGRSVALTGTWTHSSGWYADGLLSFGRYSGPVSSNERGRVGTLRGDSYDASVEVGRTIAFSSGLQIEPQFQLRSQTLRIRNFTDDDGVKAKFDNQQIWSGRVGVLASYTLSGTQSWSPYARVDLMHSTGGAGTVNLSGKDYSPGRVGSAARLAIGANGMLTRNLALYGEVAGQRRIGAYGFSGGDINLGVRYQF